jgi:hypothetical protein
MINSIHVARLETSDNILLGQYTQYLVSDRFIVTIDFDKILQFSNKGQFIRTLAKAGKGPDEFSRVDAFALDGENDILYINHRGDQKHIIVYNLQSGERIKRIPTGVDNLISRITVLNDTILAITPRMNKDFNLYYLSTSGEIIDGITPSGIKGIGLETQIEKTLNNLYYMPKEYDTLYSLNRTTKEPYCFFNVDDRFTFDNNEIGNFIYFSTITPSFMIVNKVHASIKINDSDGETYSMNGDKVISYWIDKEDFSVTEITGYYNDYFGIDEKFDPWKNYLFVNNHLAFLCYSSIDLKQLIEETLESGGPDNNIKQRITALNEQINENDNPILLIGKLKTH